MKIFLKLSLMFSFLTLSLHAERKKVEFSMVISGGVSLGAYEAGYNWAAINILKRERLTNTELKPELRSVSGASAGSINSLLTAMYWCQEDSVLLKNSIEDNLFYNTWVTLGIKDLLIRGKDPKNKSSLFTQDGLRKRGDAIIEHLNQPIYKKNCEVPLGVAVTKATPIVETISGIKVKNQNFSVPLTFKEKNGKAIVENKVLPPSTDFYLSIPGIEKDKHKLINLLLASGAFPTAFQQVKLDYEYKGKKYSNYFVDGGLYDNVPLDLAISLDNRASHFFFMDPNNMRKEPVETIEETEDEMPVGFITPNLGVLFISFDIMQSMKLYEAINNNFRGDSDKILVLSSRYHPIAGEFLGHFGAFLDKNFRIYDYYVGVYDAIYHIAEAYRIEGHTKWSQIEVMNYLKTILGMDENPEALAAYKLFLNTEFYHAKPKTTDRFSAIYNSFDLNKTDAKRYSMDEFKEFLSKLDMKYLEKEEDSYIVYAKNDIDNMHKRPLRRLISRITTLENERGKIGKSDAYGTVAAVAAWSATSFTKEKKGFEFLPLNVPHDEGEEGFRTALRFLPGEIASDLKNGGVSFGYTALYHLKNKDIISGFEGKASYVLTHNAPDYIRGDIGIYKEYDDFLKIGVGGSFFGNLDGSFYQRDNVYGINTYVSIMDIFRLTYVHRNGDTDANSHIYIGIDNIPSLIYWLNR